MTALIYPLSCLMRRSFLSLVFCMVLTPSLAWSWWNDEWKSRKQITIDASSTGGDIKENLADFPLLVRNILTYLAPSRPQPSYQTGEAVVVALPPAPLPILAQQPANGQARIVTRATDVVLVDVTQVGAYRINDTWVVANLLAPAESRVDRLASAAPVIATPWLLPAGIALGQWLLVLGILGLCGERWLTWRLRRVT